MRLVSLGGLKPVSDSSLMNTLNERGGNPTLVFFNELQKVFLPNFDFFMCSHVHTIWNELHKEERQTSYGFLILVQ